MKKDFNPSAPWASRLCPGQTYGRNFATRSEVIVKWMVASSQPLATQIGLDILKKGGTAVAAIAVNAALGLMEPTGSGVGGDFAIVWDAKTEKLWIKRQWKIAKDINDVLF
jgi:gamma-glutamyltranspeptidase